ncbi:glycosyltransferase [Algoriphagus halophytocola]|uniref:Glycosyltransferase n=1 Tax=Algoriphagus halophytocola TaxID=2991499 RepID=A0ABY6MMA1_9BACT|nr:MULTISPECIES: glycosyltransferase [unclassified Algoriphagus]UZD23527.1 glycosyltransferase [Algoriphagus sp. TR-M5]WBL44821.1 glycosyltransferase [Algoriphagus sp. TR-M9]
MGFSQKPVENCEGEIHYASLARTQSTWARLYAQLRFLKILLKVRPKILIVCTYEFLPIACFFKRKIGYALLYDVQENYIKNLDLNPELTETKKSKAKALIREAEQISGVDLYLLAEKCYQIEMPEKKPFLVLENKFSGKIHVKSPINIGGQSSFRFLLSGTITPAFGCLEAVKWFKEIAAKFPNSSLEILGHVTLPKFKNELEKACLNHSNIHLNIQENPVDHSRILEAMKQADFALLPYQNHAAIRDKMPTKLFESAALGVPVLISPNPIWEDFLADFSGGFSVDFSNPSSAIATFEAALSMEYFTQIPSDSILWDSQKKKFIQAIASL